MRQLAKDDDIAVAGPVLQQSPRLAETDLVDIARTKSQAHLLAISGRTGIAEAVTDVLVRRGDREVVRSVADNQIAPAVRRRLPDAGEAGRRGRHAGREGRHASRHSAAAVPRTAAQGDRGGAAAAARRRQARDPGRDPARAGQGVDGVGSATRATTRAAQRDGASHCTGGQAQRDASLSISPSTGQYEETVAALSLLCAVPIESVDRLMGGDRPDPVLILCKAAGCGWPTVRAIILSRPGGKGTSTPGARYRLRQFRAAVARDRAARDAVLAGRSRIQAPTPDASRHARLKIR